MTKEKFPPTPVEWPNLYQGDEYPLNYVFTDEPDGPGSIVGHCDVNSMAGDELKAVIRYLLVWDSNAVISMTEDRYHERYDGNGKCNIQNPTTKEKQF